MSDSSHPESVVDLIEDLRRLPGVGRKTATRYAYWLVSQDQEYLTSLGKKIHRIKQAVKICRICGNKTEYEICHICQNTDRRTGQLCIVEQAEDILQFEKIGVYRGMYHVLGGVVDPLKNITLDELYTETLSERIEGEHIKEVILALNPTMQGDATNLALKEYFQDTELIITKLGRGISIGSTLEYLDSATLKEALESRR